MISCLVIVTLPFLRKSHLVTIRQLSIHGNFGMRFWSLNVLSDQTSCLTNLSTSPFPSSLSKSPQNFFLSAIFVLKTALSSTFCPIIVLLPISVPMLHPRPRWSLIPTYLPRLQTLRPPVFFYICTFHAHLSMLQQLEKGLPRQQQ